MHRAWGAGRPPSVDLLPSSKMKIKEPNVWKLNFLVITRLLKPRKSVFCFSAPPTPALFSPANSHMAFGNQRILPHHNKTKATVPETGKGTGSHRFPPGGVVGLETVVLPRDVTAQQPQHERVCQEAFWCLAACQLLAQGACGWSDRLLPGSIWGQSRLGRGLAIYLARSSR